MRSPVLSPRQFEWTLAAFVATLLAHLMWLPAWYGVTLCGIVLARWLQRRAYARAWPGWIKFPLLVAVLALVVFEFGNPFARQAGTAALVGLSTLKLIESERRRDGLLILTVALFLVSVQFLFNQGLGIALYMVIPTLLIFLALNEVSAPPGTRGGLTVRLGSIGREFLLMLAVVLPLTVFLFLSVPRLSEPLWGTRENQWESRTGLSEEMSPGDLTELLGDDTPVMRVTFVGTTPAKASLYWRGPVLWQFDGTTWRSAPRLASANITDGRLRGPQSGGSTDVRYRVVLEPTDRNWLHPLDLATGFPADSSRSLEGVVTRDRPVTGLYAFEAASRIDAPVPVLAFPGLQTSIGLALPTGLNPRTVALAQSWVDEVGSDPTALTRRALTHIRNENFSYSRSPPPLVGAHRMDEFLFDTQSGFCEHYAAAFVVLMRGAGVPARVVTGFLGGDFNRIGGYWIVRNSDAHAWAEVLMPGQGWVRVDPTAAIAPERVDQGAGGLPGQDIAGDYDWLRTLRERADAVRSWWNNAVVRFDSVRQQSFFADLGINPNDWKQVAVWMGGGLGVLGLLTALVFYLQQRRDPEDAARRLYRRYLKELARLGVVSAANEGPSDLARRAGDALPKIADAILEFTRAYESARYGVPDSGALARLRRALVEFRILSRQ